MDYKKRLIEPLVARDLQRGKSILLLGARQTGKTTLISRFQAELSLSFIRPDVRLRYEKQPGLLAAEIEQVAREAGNKQPLVVLDEVQKFPICLDLAQDLIDRRIAQFILTGSSARKLRRGANVNLLPGRVVTYRLDPFAYEEDPVSDLDQHLFFGALPGIRAAPDPQTKQADLHAYVVTYLEEEVRQEALVRDVGAFARALELAAMESGQTLNFSKLSQDIGVAHTTMAGYFEILEDCLIAERIEPLPTPSGRRRLTKAPKFLLFDLGVRRVCAREGTHPTPKTLGALFEQFVGLELIRMLRLTHNNARVHYWRSHDGPEVDWIIDWGDRLTPIEVKWTDAPQLRDARHLLTFMHEFQNRTAQGFVVCRTPRAFEIAPNISAVPWQRLRDVVRG